MHPSASGGRCAVIHGRIASRGAGSLWSGNACQPESLSELLDSRPMKFLGFHAEDAWKTITWFQKKGQRAVLFGRCIPIIRSLISVPAGWHGWRCRNFCCLQSSEARCGTFFSSEPVLRSVWRGSRRRDM